MPRSAGGGRRYRSGPNGKKPEPVLEHHRRRSSGRDIRTSCERRKFGAQRGLAFSARALLKACKRFLSFCVEIAGRNGRIGVLFAGEKTGDVTQIFPLQRHGVVFRMSLKEYEIAAQL